MTACFFVLISADSRALEIEFRVTFKFNSMAIHSDVEDPLRTPLKAKLLFVITYKPVIKNEKREFGEVETRVDCSVDAKQNHRYLISRLLSKFEDTLSVPVQWSRMGFRLMWQFLFKKCVFLKKQMFLFLCIKYPDLINYSLQINLNEKIMYFVTWTTDSLNLGINFSQD